MNGEGLRAARKAASVPRVADWPAGYDEVSIPARYAHVTRCEKPVEPEKIAKALFWLTPCVSLTVVHGPAAERDSTASRSVGHR